MKKTIIAAALTSVIAAPAFAVDLYKDDTNSATMGGYVGVRAISQGDTTDLENGSSRINFKFSHKMANGWTAGLVTEWAIDPFDSNNSTTFTDRLGNVYFDHADHGRITIGKQWSAYYNAVAATDSGFFGGGAASGAYASENKGTGRSNNTIQYTNDIFGFDFAGQIQVGEGEDTGAGFSLARKVGAVNLTAGATFGTTHIAEVKAVDAVTTTQCTDANGDGVVDYNECEKTVITAAVAGQDAYESDYSAFAIGASYGKITDGLFLAANYSVSENLYDSVTTDETATGIEAFVSYQMGDIRPYAFYNNLTSDADGADAAVDVIGLGTLYQIDKAILTYAEILIDNVEGEDNQFAVGMRYTF